VAHSPRLTWRCDALSGCADPLSHPADQPRLRATVKSFGARLPKCSAQSFHKRVAGELPDELAETLQDIVATIASLTERIRNYDHRVEHLSKEHYPQQTELLRQVPGVGALTHPLPLS
jgi:transposase